MRDKSTLKGYTKHEHYFRAIAYFYAEKNDEEWLILKCDDEDCGYTKVIQGISLRK